MDNKAWKADPPFAGPPVTQDSPGVIPVAFMPADQVQNAFSGETGAEGKIKKKKKKKHPTSPLKVEGGRKASKDEIMPQKQGIDLYGINGPVTVPNPAIGGMPKLGSRPETKYGDMTEEAFKEREKKRKWEEYMPEMSMGMDMSGSESGGGYMTQASPVQPIQLGGVGGNPYLEQLIAMLSRGGFFRGSPRSQSR